MNTRALASAGFTRADVPSPIGTQSAWTAGGGPTLLLLHGAGDSAGTWSSIVKTFTPRYRVVIPDLAGHGMSAPAEGPIPYLNLYGKVKELADKKQIGNISVSLSHCQDYAIAQVLLVPKKKEGS